MADRHYATRSVRKPWEPREAPAPEAKDAKRPRARRKAAVTVAK